MKELRNSKKILIPRFDSHGDIILFSGFLAALIEKLPDAEVTILVREGHEQLAPLLPGNIKWVTTRIFPYKPFDFNEVGELKHLLLILEEGPWDALLTTCYTRTWLDFVIAARLSGVTRYAIGEYRPAVDWVKDLLKWLSLSEEKLWDHYVEVEESSHEIEKYSTFFRHIFNCDNAIPLPKLDINKENDAQARSIIEELGLEADGFFVCLPAGTHNISIKCWPPDRFVELLLQIQEEMSLTPLLIGHETEIDVLNFVASKIIDHGGKVSIWIGQSGKLHHLAAIMQKSKFYVGNDSGPMHMAAAVGVSTVGIFGGGYWPRFLPVGQYAVGVAAVLPCFGCDWDCTFEDAPCVKIIQVSDVLEVLKSVLAGNVYKRNMSLVPNQLSLDASEYITKANNQYTRCKTYRNKLVHDNACLAITSSDNSSDANANESNINSMLKKIKKLLKKK